MKIIPTEEQQNILAKMKDLSKLKVNAGAGCAKTTTLRLIAEDNNVPSLYLVFNKKNEVEAKSKFPSWVEVRTTHSLAYREFGIAIRHKLQRPVGRYENVCGTGTEIAKHFMLKDFAVGDKRKISANGVGLAIKETVNKFEFSGDSKLSHEHVSYSPVGSLIDHIDFNRSAYTGEVLKYAKKLWNLRKDGKNNILATHDTYLKMYQLSTPNLSKYEIIYLDEAQDTNQCVLDIISKQKSKIVLVGDEHQQIYAWRGSINAMKKFPADTALLSKSFRFGEEIAALANLVINRDLLVGHEDINTKVEKYLNEEEVGQYTILYRTNTALIFDAVDYLAEGKIINLEFDVIDFTRYLESAMYLFKGEINKVKHENLLPYSGWEDLVYEASIESGELARVANIMESGQYRQILNLLKEHENSENPDIILTTAHKSKGREWDIVVLAEDYPSPLDHEGRYIGLSPEETNLLYVAITRAKKLLVYNNTVDVILTKREKPNYSGLQLRVKSIQQLSPGYVTERHLRQFRDIVDANDNYIEAIANMDVNEELLPFEEEEIIRENTVGMFKLI